MAAATAGTKPSTCTRWWRVGKPCDDGTKREEDEAGDAEVLARASAGEVTLVEYMRRSGFSDWDFDNVRRQLPDPALLVERDAPDHIYFVGHGNTRLAHRWVDIVYWRKHKRGRSNPFAPAFTIAFQHPALRTLASDLAHERDASAELLAVAASVAAVQRQEYSNASQRRDALVSQLKPVFEACGLPFRYAICRKTRGAAVPDIALSVCDAADAGSSVVAADTSLIAAMIQVKPAQDTSSDPWSELYSCYRKRLGIWSDCYFSWCSSMPCVLAAVRGQEWEVGGGVVENAILAERLSGQPQLDTSRADSDAIADLARRLRAWAQAVHNVADALVLADHELSSISEGTSLAFPPTVPMDVAFAFPHFVIGEHRLRFVQHLARGAYRATWQGAPSGYSNAVVFKATWLNNDEAQNLMAAAGWAPRIHACETVYGRGGEEWTALVMEDLVVQGFRAASSETLVAALTEADTAAISKQVAAALAVLHSHGFVFFDLRLPNIMVRKSVNDGEWSVRLIDFEMCGRRDTPLVWVHLNEDFTWPPYRFPADCEGDDDDASWCHILHEDDDEFMLEHLWDDYLPLSASVRSR